MTQRPSDPSSSQSDSVSSTGVPPQQELHGGELTAGSSSEVPPSHPLETPDGVEHPHNFEVQKQLHKRIRNDPDYDDWEYGTEPLPQETWTVKQPPASA